jgi:hypothetical protein
MANRFHHKHFCYEIILILHQKFVAFIDEACARPPEERVYTAERAWLDRGCCFTLLSDKTGTLTNRITVVEGWFGDYRISQEDFAKSKR